MSSGLQGAQLRVVMSRVVSSEISPGKFPEIYSSLTGNFRKFVKECFFTVTRFNYNHIKINNMHVFDKQLSKSLRLTSCIMFRKK